MQLIIKINNALPNILQLQNVYLTNSLNKINTPMRKLLLLALIFTAKIGFAQTYSQGDISVITNFSFSHDSAACSSVGAASFEILVQNSFVGDIVKVKNINDIVVATYNNTNGQNPWTIIHTLGGWSVFNDYTGALGCNIWAPPLRFLNDNDSLNTLYSNQVFYPTNLCEYVNISGRVYVDQNSDCLYNSNLIDGLLSNPYNLNIQGNYNGSFSDFYNYNAVALGDGLYSIHLQKSYFIDGSIGYLNSVLPFAYPNSCTQSIYTFDNSTVFPQVNNDFVLQCNSNVDLSVFAGISSPIKPGIPFLLFPHIGNLGCDTVSGWLKLVLDNRLTFNSALSANQPDVIAGDTLTWFFNGINNLSNNGFWNSLTAAIHLIPDTTLNIGDTICFNLESNMPLSDINTTNNQYAVCYPVVNSYDPNIKEVMPKGVGATGVIPPITSELTYTVHFQNTGNASAINVYIIDTLDVNVIPESIEILGRSHTMTPQWLAPGVLKFNFNNINLADSFSNEPASHGFVTFKAKLESNLNLGTVIENTAYIYFDFNAPIITNTAINTIDLLTTISVQTVNANLSVYPNPAKEELFISINNLNSSTTSYLEIYNIAGQKMMDQSITQQATKVDLSSLSKGLYLLKMNVEGVVSTVKIVKE